VLLVCAVSVRWRCAVEGCFGMCCVGVLWVGVLCRCVLWVWSLSVFWVSTSWPKQYFSTVRTVFYTDMPAGFLAGESRLCMEGFIVLLGIVYRICDCATTWVYCLWWCEEAEEFLIILSTYLLDKF